VPGTRIGTHGGRVAEVLKDRIIIKEKMKDVLGRMFFQNTELKLNRKS
jgi:Tfp pilus assembly protein PilP